jgi:glycosyltransferase involved in cell wall biosynthesis
VHDGENGLLVAPGDPVALADAIGRFFGDDALRTKLSKAAAGSVEGYSEQTVFATVEAELRQAVA